MQCLIPMITIVITCVDICSAVKSRSMCYNVPNIFFSQNSFRSNYDDGKLMFTFIISRACMLVMTIKLLKLCCLSGPDLRSSFGSMSWWCVPFIISGEVPNSNNQPHGYEHDGGNQWLSLKPLQHAFLYHTKHDDGGSRRLKYSVWLNIQLYISSASSLRGIQLYISTVLLLATDHFHIVQYMLNIKLLLNTERANNRIAEHGVISAVNHSFF